MAPLWADSHFRSRAIGFESGISANPSPAVGHAVGSTGELTGLKPTEEEGKFVVDFTTTAAHAEGR
jgi:hypothetical protein